MWFSLGSLVFLHLTKGSCPPKYSQYDNKLGSLKYRRQNIFTWVSCEKCHHLNFIIYFFDRKNFCHATFTWFLREIHVMNLFIWILSQAKYLHRNFTWISSEKIHMNFIWKFQMKFTWKISVKFMKMTNIWEKLLSWVNHLHGYEINGDMFTWIKRSSICSGLTRWFPCVYISHLIKLPWFHKHTHRQDLGLVSVIAK